VYRGITSSQYNNIPANSTFNQLINAGVSHPTGVLIVPFLAPQWSRYYFVNVERSNKEDKLVARNINISFLKTSLLPLDCMVFVFFSEGLTIDVNTGIITKQLS
jgi:hypothetical protein